MQDSRDIFSVSRLNAELKAVTEGSFPLLWVQGEISNLSAPRSGHLYFSLKDSNAQIRCALFRNRRQLLRELPKDGDQVTLRAKIGFYEPRGDCQLIVESLEKAGAGDLQQAFELLKKKLSQEGLFATERKQALPSAPKRIGLITSPSGAALRDVLQVLSRRYPSAQILIYPSAVQGAAAPAELTAAVKQASTRNEVDVLVLTRGGGSAEDLAAFNDEALARAIADCPIPLVSAVGHEVDFSIADFVADRRAPTPSAAAELISPDSQTLVQSLDQAEQRLRSALRRQLAEAQQRWQRQDARLARLHPGIALAQQQQGLDALARRLHVQLQTQLQQRERRLHALQQRLLGHDPRHHLAQWRERITAQRQRLQRAAEQSVINAQHRFAEITGRLNTVSPLATLARGYAIALNDEGQALRSSQQAQRGQTLKVKLAEGALDVRVEKIE